MQRSASIEDCITSALLCVLLIVQPFIAPQHEHFPIIITFFTTVCGMSFFIIFSMNALNI